MREEILPKNIIMIGPTGVGKTEIARRLAKLVNAPFIKVEATKFTEVGYVGRDVESIIRDLVETSIRLVKAEKVAEVEDQAKQAAELRILDMLQPLPRTAKMGAAIGNILVARSMNPKKTRVKSQKSRPKKSAAVGYGCAISSSKGNLDKEIIEDRGRGSSPADDWSRKHGD